MAGFPWTLNISFSFLRKTTICSGRFVLLSQLNPHSCGSTLQATKTLFGVPDFHYYTLASGIAHVFPRCPKPKIKPPNTFQYYEPLLL